MPVRCSGQVKLGLTTTRLTPTLQLAYCNRTSLEMGRLADPFLLDAIKSDRDLTDITFLVLNGRLDNVSAGNATDATTVKSLTYSEQVGRVAETISRTLFRGGMVLLPLTASPDSLDVLDAIHAHVHSSSSLRFQTTLVSPVIRRLLLRIGINTEWTPNVEQTLAKVLQYQMDGQDAPQRTGSQPPRSIAPTFGEAKLGSSGRHLVVADHPNMLIGDAQWIAEWARGRNDAILVVHTGMIVREYVSVCDNSISLVRPITRTVDHFINDERHPSPRHGHAIS